MWNWDYVASSVADCLAELDLVVEPAASHHLLCAVRIVLSVRLHNCASEPLPFNTLPICLPSYLSFGLVEHFNPYDETDSMYLNVWN